MLLEPSRFPSGSRPRRERRAPTGVRLPPKVLVFTLNPPSLPRALRQLLIQPACGFPQSVARIMAGVRYFPPRSCPPIHGQAKHSTGRPRCLDFDAQFSSPSTRMADRRAGLHGGPSRWRTSIWLQMQGPHISASHPVEALVHGACGPPGRAEPGHTGAAGPPWLAAGTQCPRPSKEAEVNTWASFFTH